MPALKNTRHERFAQELAKGRSQVEAYVNAGYSHSRSAAARLFADVSICERVAEIANRVADRTELTVAAITERLMGLAAVAEKTGIQTDEKTGEAKASSPKHLAVARAALMDAAKLNGLVVDRAEVKSELEVTDARERLSRIVAGHTAAAGLGGGAGKPH